MKLPLTFHQHGGGQTKFSFWVNFNPFKAAAFSIMVIH